jgi:hypothetical protein
MLGCGEEKKKQIPRVARDDSFLAVDGFFVVALARRLG